MNFAPVIVRELRLIARRPRTYYARSLAALTVLIVCLGVLYAGFAGVFGAASVGRDLFRFLSILGYAYVLVNGVFGTADCLSQEKREGTIGLLFLTPLKAHEIIGGKLVSRTANAAYCLAASLPALGLSVFLGGVTGNDFFRMALVLMNGLFFAAAFSLLVSGCCRRERQALSTALFGTLLLGVLLPWMGEEVRLWQKTASIHPAFVIASPAGAFLDAAGFSASLGISGCFKWSLLATHLFGWTCLGLASVILPRSWREKPVITTRRAFPAFWESRVKMPSTRPCAALVEPSMRMTRWGRNAEEKRRRALERNPLLWLAQRPGVKGLGVAWLFATAVIVWLVAFLIERAAWLSLPVYGGTALLFYVLLLYATAVSACRGPAEDRRSGVLELLLTTPLGAEGIVQARLLALKRRLMLPLLFVLAVDAALAAAGCLQFRWYSGDWIPWIALFLALIVHLFVDLYALCWVGTWLGFKLPSMRQAVSQTIGKVLLLRWLLLFAAIAALGLGTQGRAFNSPVMSLFPVFGYVALSAMNLLYFCGLAASELKDELRELVAGLPANDATHPNWRPLAGLGPAKRRLTASLDCLQKLRAGTRSRSGADRWMGG